MNKILLEITCPGTSSNYDFWISKKMKIGKAKMKIMDEIRCFEQNPELFQDPSQVFFVHENSQILNEPQLTMQQAKIKSGDHLYII